MRDRASRHRDQLAELIHQADLARRLLDDPAAAAQAAEQEAGQAERLAGQPQALDALRSSASTHGALATSTRSSSRRSPPSITAKSKTSTAS